jgi:hypothetical protein
MTDHLHVRLHPDRDQDLIDHFDSLPDSYGAVTMEAKNLLRLGLAVSQEAGKPNTPAISGLDADALQGLTQIIEILPDKMLPDIRKVVESVVRTELGKISIIGPEQPKDGDEDESEAIEDMLSAMESELVDGQI